MHQLELRKEAEFHAVLSMHVMMMLQVAEVSLALHIIVGSFAQEMKSQGNAGIWSADLFGSKFRADKGSWMGQKWM